MKLVLDSYVPFVSNLTVDFGGDLGQFFPPQSIGERVVVDVSSRELPSGIGRAESIETIDGIPDLVLICHVLEHLNDPLQVLKAISGVQAPGGLLYVEVPLDRPQPKPHHSTSKYFRYLSKITRHRRLLIACDFISGVSRQYGRRIPRFGFIKQSEHINYFSRESLEKLLQLSGYNIQASESDPQATIGGLRMGRLGILAAKV
jgi:ubiquinone/menaquinone biosynthesis C-methylase UbiE